MARVPYAGLDASADGKDADLARLFEEIGALRGEVLHLHRALANQPRALRAFMVMSRFVRDEADLPPRIRELAVLATAFALGVPYEQHHHAVLARRAGVSEAQVAAFPDWRSAAHLFDGLERAVLEYADQTARRRDVDEAVFQDLRHCLPLPQVVDLAVTVGWYHFCAAILGPLRIETESAAPSSA